MCGILCILSYNHARAENLEKILIPLLRNRGPDSHHSHSINIDTSVGICQLSFHGTVLSLRGNLTSQPMISEAGHVFLWNGEIFGGDIMVPENTNDTSILFELLNQLPFSDASYQQEMVSIFSKIQGPWAFVFYDAVNMNLWYGRDHFGRRSLMSSYKDDVFVLSSLGHRIFNNEFTEVPAKVLYCLDVKDMDKYDLQNRIETFEIPVRRSCLHGTVDNCLLQHRCLTHAQMNNIEIENKSDEDFAALILKLRHTVCFSKENMLSPKESRSCCKCESRNKQNKNLEMNGSGLCQLVHSSNVDLEINTETEVDSNGYSKHGDMMSETCFKCLLRASQGNSSLNDRIEKIGKSITNLNAGEIKEIYSSSLCKIPIPASCSFCQLPILTLKSLQNQFSKSLQEAVWKRVHNLPRSKNLKCNENEGSGSKVGILFSGGIDSVVLTYFADRCTPRSESIDLINVAFEQKPKAKQNVKEKYQKSHLDNKAATFDVPDRLTGRAALRELPKERKWNFIEVDVTLEELQRARKSNITNLVYPLESVLDDSIGCAIWFAARGVGSRFLLSDDDDEMQLVEENYQSPVKVLLTGIGADEQLGGYARHRTKFESLGWVGLGKEMEMELGRISTRNLGRDDRCISDHGREARFPFLDENVVSFLQDLPVCVKCDPRLPRGEGEKILLRELALSLDLPFASKLPKRAIQFGSRIAKLESIKEKGSDNCKRLGGTEL